MLHGILNGPEMKSGSSDNCIVGQDGGDGSFDVAYRRAAAGLAAAAWGSDYNDEYSSNSPRSFRNKGQLRSGDLDGQRSFSAFRFVGKSMAPDWPSEMRKNKVLPSSNAPTDEVRHRHFRLLYLLHIFFVYESEYGFVSHTVIQPHI